LDVKLILLNRLITEFIKLHLLFKYIQKKINVSMCIKFDFNSKKLVQ